MKLVSCHIENFGKLHDCSLDFAEGLNTVCEENGWGKSTFAAFVRAMFYGLEGERKRNVEENERKRFKPWQGGVFGGQLTFETRGRQYTISRVFREKETQDEFEVRDARTNLPTADYTQRIGEEIFKIDRASFLRTIFIGQNACETSVTDDINAKIGNLTDRTNDMNSYEDACGRLTEVMNRLTPRRSTGSIARRETEITALERAVQDGSRISASIDTYQGYLQAESEMYGQRKRQMQETAREQARVSEWQALLARKAEWERLKKAALSRQEAYEAERAKFPGDIPTAAEVEQRLTSCGAMERAAERVSLYAMSDGECRELAGLQDTFARGTATDEEIERMLADAQRLRTLRQEEAAGRMSEEEEERIAELGEAFARDAQPVSFYTIRWNDRNARQSALPSKQAGLAALKASMVPPEPKRKVPAPALPGVLLAAVGAGALAVGLSENSLFGLSVLGAILMALGVVLFGMNFFHGMNFIHGMNFFHETNSFHVRRQSAGKQEEPEVPSEFEELQSAIETDRAFIENADREMEAYLVSHGKHFDEFSVSLHLQEIAEDYMEYSALKKKALRAANSQKLSEMASLESNLAVFLRQYGISPVAERFADDLYFLKNSAARYGVLREKQENHKESRALCASLREEVCAFLRQYGFAPAEDLRGQLNAIRDGIGACQDARKLSGEVSAELQSFEDGADVAKLAETAILEAAGEEMPSLEELNRKVLELTAKMEESHKAILGYNKILGELQEKYEQWEEDRLKLESQKELQEQEQAKYRHVSEAHRYLKLAKESITEKYSAPILAGFREYYEMLAGGSAGNFHIDANTAVTVTELGIQREVNTLSTGCRDLVGICLRIALVDAMYREEAPVLILDDPFTNLDDRRLTAGKELLRRIAGKYQVVYFTCSRGRKESE